MADYAHWLDRQELDRGNLRAVLAWTIESQYPELAYALIIESNRFWRARGPVPEGIEWMEAVLALTPDGKENHEAASHEARTALRVEQFDRLWQEGRSTPPANFLLEAPPEISAQPAAGSGLTRREREVLALLTRGLTNQEIANQLSISVHTVERHITNLYTKLGVRSRTEAAHWAHHHA